MHRSKFPAVAAVLLTAFATFLSSCADFGSFSFTEESDVIIVDGSGSLPISDLLPTRIPMNVDLDQELQEQDASGAQAVYLTDLRLELADESEEETFDFLDSMTISVSSESNEPETIAWRDPVGTDQREVVLDVDDSIDIKPHSEEGLRFRTQASGSAPDDDAAFTVSATFRVQVL